MELKRSKVNSLYALIQNSIIERGLIIYKFFQKKNASTDWTHLEIRSIFDTELRVSSGSFIARVIHLTSKVSEHLISRDLTSCICTLKNPQQKRISHPHWKLHFSSWKTRNLELDQVLSCRNVKTLVSNFLFIFYKYLWKLVSLWHMWAELCVPLCPHCPLWRNKTFQHLEMDHF